MCHVDSWGKSKAADSLIQHKYLNGAMNRQQDGTNWPRVKYNVLLPKSRGRGSVSEDCECLDPWIGPAGLPEMLLLIASFIPKSWQVGSLPCRLWFSSTY